MELLHSYQQWQDEINQSQTENEKLRNEKKQLGDRIYRQRPSLLRPMKANQPLNDKSNNQQTQVTERGEVDTQFNNEIIVQKFLTVLYKIDQQRIDNENENKQLNDSLNEVGLQCTVLQEKNKELTSQLEQLLKIDVKEIESKCMYLD